ncbi:unnamed protein product, partial [Rotaria magnacalcarata]
MVPNDMPFQFKRLQFPVRLAFAMSINKPQGQSLKVAGINLGAPCFSHGQLYVAYSRLLNDIKHSNVNMPIDSKWLAIALVFIYGVDVLI